MNTVKIPEPHRGQFFAAFAFSFFASRVVCAAFDAADAMAAVTNIAVVLFVRLASFPGNASLSLRETRR